MQNQDKFTLLRTLLRALGLSQEAIDDIVDRIVDWMAEKNARHDLKVNYPYHLRDDFLSPTERNFYRTLQLAVMDWALICPKVALGDLFYARGEDASATRSLTNKIDRKHVDFLLCDPSTLRPILGIELDDKSHQRPDRKERDAFVGKVFAAAKLPLARVPVQRGYSPMQLTIFLRQHLGDDAPAVPIGEPTPKTELEPRPVAEPLAPMSTEAAPPCPKCKSPMLLRTARSGPNVGAQFWGCPNYPRCRGTVKVTGS